MSVRRPASRAQTAPPPEGALASRALGLAVIALCTLYLLAGLSPPAAAQVFSSQPYVAAPDPAVEQLRARIEALEADLKTATDRAEALGAALGEARRIAEDADAGRRAAEQAIAALLLRVEALEDTAADAALAQGADAASIEPGSAMAGSAAQGSVSQGSVSQGPVSLTPAGAAPGPGPAAAEAGLPADEAGLFDYAKGLLLNEANFPAAEQGFSTFLTRYPRSAQAGDAQYYLGEALLYQDNFTDAAAAYGKLIKDFPQSANAPTGLVKLARSLRLMGNTSQACRTLSLMSQNFPKASAVARQLASQERQQSKCS